LQGNTFEPPRNLNNQISLRTEQAILWAMSMHPNDRPADVQSFRDLLLSTGPLSLWPALKGQDRLQQIAPINRILGGIILFLLFIALLATIFSPSPP
jgi:eukaryotic-like serine/threonine-protein kinase